MSEEISREEIAALLARGNEEMTREEAIRCLSVHSSTNGSGLCTDKQHYEAKQVAIKALEQEPCEDAISRQAMHIELEKWITYGEYKYSNATKYLYDRIDRLPSVNPQEREVLEKIKSEIEGRKKNSGGEPNRDIAFNVCLQIIDKYREPKESEEQA